MATIDSLNIQISADASRATNALNNLEKKLTSLSKSLNGLNGLNITSFSQSVSHLANSMKAFDNSSKNISFSKYANGLKKFNEVNATSIISVGNSLKQLANGMNAVSSASFNVDGLNSLVQSINRLGGVKGVSGTQNLLKIKDNLQMFIRGMNNIGSVTFQVESLSSLVTSISRLGSVNSNNATKNLPTLSAQLQNFINQLNRIGSLNFDSTNLVTLINSISRLGSKSVLNATNNIPRLATELKNLFTTLSTAPPINQNVINMTNALANLGRSGLRFNNINNQMNKGLTRTSHSMNKTRKSAKGLASAIGMFYAKWFIAIRGIKKLMQSVEQSMNYIETLNYFNSSFGQVATNANLNSWKELGYESANAYYDSFAKRAEYLTQQMTGFAVSENGMLSRTGQKNFGMNPTEIMNYQAMFAQMSSSMGVSSENALKLSRALTEIGGDLASVKNLEFGETYKKLASGLVGMSRTMDIFGINIRNANLQLKLNSLGIEANVQNLSQADKALLRTIIILDDSKFAWTDLARTLEQPANQFRLLKSNVNNLSRSVGNIFLPIIAKTIPYINGFVIALSRLADYIVKLLGFEGFEWGGIGGADSDILSNLLDDADGLSDTLDGASDSAKKLKNELMGFDEINKLSDKSDDESLSNGIDGLTSGLLDAAFNEALERYQREWDKAFDNMENKANNVADNIVKAFKSGDFYSIGSTISASLRETLDSIDWQKIYTGFGKFSSGIAEFLNGFINPDTFHSVGETIANSLNTSIHTWLVFSEDFDWSNFGSSLADGINGFFEGFDFHQLAEGLNSFVDGLEDAIASFLKGLKWKDIIDKTEDFLGDLELDTVAVIIGAFALKTAPAKLKAMLAGVIAKKLAGVTIKSLAVSFGEVVLVTGGNIAGLDKLGADLLTKITESIQKYIPENIQKLYNFALSFATGSGFVAIMLEEIQGSSIGEMFIKGVVSDIFNFDMSKDLAKVTSKFFKDAKKAFKEEKWGELGENILLGILGGFTTAFSFITEPITDFFNSIVQHIKDIFGIHSPAKNMNELGENILLGIVEGFTNKISEFNKAISDWWENDVKPWFTVTKWNGLFSNIKTSLSAKWSETVNEWNTNISKWWNDDVSPWFTINKWLNLFGNIKSAIVTKWTEITNWWSNTAIYQWWRDDVSPWFSVSTWEKGLNGIKTAFANTFNDIIESAKTWGSDMINGFVDGIESAGSTLETGVEKAAKKIKKFLHFSRPDAGPLRDYEKWMPDFMHGLAKGISDNEYVVSNSIESLANKMSLLNGYSVNVNPISGNRSNVFEGSYETINRYNDNTKSNSYIGSDIRSGIRDANSEQNALLREQNELLRELLRKDYGISSKDIFNSVRSSANDYTIRTGQPAFPV